MLGLGSLLSAAASLRTEVQRLFSKLRGRSTYYENNDDSQASVRDTFNYGLLDKATIVLTPTATSDKIVHSVKTFTGNELIENGNFDTDLTGWSNANNHWQWTNQGAYFPLISTHNPLSQVLSNSADDRLKITFTLNIINGTANVVYIKADGSTVQTQYTASGTYTIYTVPLQANTTLSFSRYGGINSEFYLNDISVVDVSSDFTFDRASSATRINSDGLIQDMQSITDPEFVKNGDFSQIGDEEVTNGNFATDSDWSGTGSNGYSISSGKLNLSDTPYATNVTQGNVTTVDKIYKVTFEVSNYVKGSVRIFLGGSVTSTVNSDGAYTFYVTASANTSAGIQAFSGSGTTLSIDNVSVKEVLQDWTFTGAASGYQELTANGIKMYSGSVSDANNALSRSATLNLAGTLNKTYKMEITASDFVNGTAGFVRLDGVYDANNIISFVPGTQTVYFKAYRNFTFIQFFAGSADAFITVKSISIKEVTFSDDVDLARINYDASGQNGHILLEPTRTNLIIYSEDFTESGYGWNYSSNAIELTESNSIISPDGTQSADKISKTAVRVYAYAYRVETIISGQPYSWSMFMKKGTHDIGYLTLSQGDTEYKAYFDLTNGTSGMFTGSANTNIEDVGNGWFRCSLQGVFSTTDVSVRFNFGMAYSTSNENWPSASEGAGLYVYFWGAQLEAGSYATSYIPTLVGSTVTRAVETLKNSGNTTLINSTEGVLFAEIATLSENSTTATSGLTLGFDITNKVMIFSSSGITKANLRRSDSADNQIFDVLTASESKSFNKIAILYKSGQNKVFVNGSRVANTNFDSFTFDYVGNSKSFTKLEFANGSSTGGIFEGKVKQLAVFNEALEDDELELLTGITNFSSFSATASGGGYTVI